MLNEELGMWNEILEAGRRLRLRGRLKGSKFMSSKW
jgi:hypothetical protein